MAIGIFRVAAADDQLEALKQRLAEEPCVALVRYSVSQGPKTPVQTNLLAACGSDYVLKHTKKESDFSRPISRTNVNTAPLFIGRISTTRWQIAGYKVTRSYVPDKVNPDPYATMADSCYQLVAEALTFCPGSLQPGTFVWSGNQFTVKLNSVAQQLMKSSGRTAPDFLERITRGQLERLPDGRAALTAPIFGRVELEFAGHSSLPAGWPKTATFIDNGKIVRKIHYETVQFGTAEEIAKLANPSTHITAEVQQASVWSNSVEILREKPGDLVVSLVREELAAQLRNKKPKGNPRPYYFMGIASVSLAGLMWYAIARNRKSE